MHSTGSRAPNGISSAKRPCEDPNRSFTSEARNEHKASAAGAGSVIMHRGLKCLLHNSHGLVVVGQFGSRAATIPARSMRKRMARASGEHAEPPRAPGATCRGDAAQDRFGFSAAR